MVYLKINGHQLFYETQGKDNNCLIFIHGLCGDHRVWLKNTPSFTNNYQVITIDMFGHGNSSKKNNPQAAFESMPAAISRLIEKEKIKNALLIGHSIAGNILLSCMEQNLNNVKAYVFVDCAFNATKRVVNSRNKLANSLLRYPKNQLHSAIENWYKTMMDMSADPKDNQLILSALKMLKGTWPLDFLKITNFVRKIPPIRLPTLVFESNWLTKDEPERSFKNAFKQEKFVRWPVANHFFFVYQAKKFNQKLKEFLESI